MFAVQCGQNIIADFAGLQYPVRALARRPIKRNDLLYPSCEHSLLKTPPPASGSEPTRDFCVMSVS